MTHTSNQQHQLQDLMPEQARRAIREGRDRNRECWREGGGYDAREPVKELQRRDGQRELGCRNKRHRRNNVDTAVDR